MSDSPTIYHQVVTSLFEVLEEFDTFMDWIEQGGHDEYADDRLERLNAVRERGRKLLDEIGAYDDQKRN